MVVDTVRSEALLVLERPVLKGDSSPADLHVRATMTPAGLRLEGLGCNRTVPWDTAYDGTPAGDASVDR
jgi:hypothetical protein